MANTHLNRARRDINDEFYTDYADIESELQYYWQHLRGKTVHCNCDDPLTSQFTAYFRDNFRELGLRKLISTHYRPTDLFDRRPALIQIVDSRGIHTGTLRGDGDFRSPECIDLLRQADIVVTNPPFSLFREYVPLLTQYQKQYIIVGNMDAIKYHCVFPHLQSGQMMLGRTKLQDMGVNAVWYTNIDHGYRPPPIDLTERYCPERYPAYDNCDAIDVDTISDIPADYDGVMGVPISYIERHCPEQFNLLAVTNTWSRDQWQTKEYPREITAHIRIDCTPALKLSEKPSEGTYYAYQGAWYRPVYCRILIRRR